MAGTLSVEEAKERFRQAADRLGEQAFGFLGKSANTKWWTLAGTAGLGLLLGRNSTILRILRAALPVLLQVAGQADEQEEESH